MTDNERFFQIIARHAGVDDSLNFRFIHTPAPKVSEIKGEIFLPCSRLEEIPRIIKKWETYNVYFGPALRRSGNGKKEGISNISNFFSDIDFKDTPRVEAWKRLEEFPVRPGAIVETGGGFQTYWWLKEPLNPEDIPKTETFNKRLAVYFGGDRGATDISHIMRVPGSFNRKPDRNNFQVKILELREDEIDLCDLDYILPLLPSVIPEARIINITSSEEDWLKARRLITGKPRIMAHWITPKPEDRSGHDWRLACLCIEEGITDPKLLYQIILNNPHGKAVAHAKTDKYVEDLISRCLEQFKVEVSGGNQFPKDAIRGLAKDYADAFSEYLESPWAFFAFGFLTLLGSILANRLILDSSIMMQPRLFTILLGESADDRKSESIKQTVNLFCETFGDFTPCYGVGSAEGLAEWIKKHSLTVLIFDEFKGFVSKALIESSVLLPCVNTLFESNRFHSHTKGHSIEVDSGYLSILAASTIDTYQRMWTSAFTDIGHINRLWLVPAKGERKFSIPLSIPEDCKRNLREALRTLVNGIPQTRKILQITPEAFEIFSEWYKNTPPSLFTKRLDTYGHRLMILFCANENKTLVTADITERVVKLLEWQRRVREENDVIDAEGKIARMEEGIRRALRKNNQGITRRELQRVTHYNRAGVFVWNSALKNLLSEEILFDSKKQIYRFREGRM